MVFVNEIILPKISKIDTFKVKTGASGMAANKGCVSLKFWVYDTSFIMINCHLTAGESNLDERFDDLFQCYN